MLPEAPVQEPGVGDDETRPKRQVEPSHEGPLFLRRQEDREQRHQPASEDHHRGCPANSRAIGSPHQPHLTSESDQAGSHHPQSPLGFYRRAHAKGLREPSGKHEERYRGKSENECAGGQYASDVANVVHDPHASEERPLKWHFDATSGSIPS